MVPRDQMQTQDNEKLQHAKFIYHFSDASQTPAAWESLLLQAGALLQQPQAALFLG